LSLIVPRPARCGSTGLPVWAARLREPVKPAYLTCPVGIGCLVGLVVFVDASTLKQDQM
jgi:hypothetical protein